MLRLLHQRLADRPDTEHEQAFVRIAVVAALLLYLTPDVVRDFPASNSRAWAYATTMSVVFVNALMVLGLIVARPAASVPRRVYGIAADMVSISAFVYLAGEHGLPLILLYVWIAIANGFRFGARYLVLATAVGGGTFATVVPFSDYWRAHQDIAWCLLFCFGALMLYVRSLVRKLFDALRRAEAANEAKRRFVSVMSHEMRTPLNAIINLSGMLADGTLQREQKELVATINGASRVLLQLVNGVLDFSKIEAGKLELEQVPFDLHALVNGICRMLRTQADAKGIRLHATILPEVPANLIGDPHHLRQVLINLAGNAIKFTDHGYVAIEVSLVAEEPAGARVRIAVRDTGIGIPADSLERVFESFAQADASTTRRFGGTGLGTTIAKQLVELMGGRIGVESVVGEGSTFWIEVPFARLPSSEDAPVAGRLVLASFGASARSALHAATAPAGWQIDDVGDIEGAVKAVASSSADAPVSCVIVYAPTAAAAQAIAPRYYAGTTRARPPLILCVEQLTAPEQSVCLAVGYASILAAPWEAHLVTNALRAALAIDAPPPLAPANPASGAPAEAAIYRVLVADDAPVNLAVARAVLERAGHEVTCVESGEAAMDTAAQDARGFDVLLLDLHMPGADGLATTKFIRLLNRIEARDMPIVMLTADATPEAEQDSLAAGANTLLGKPVDPKELLRTIEKLCSARKRVGRPSGTGALPNHAEALRACAEIDREVLEQLEKLGASNGFVSRLLADYLRDTEAQMDAAQRALEAGRVDELREALHAIKGASGSVGAVGMARVCTEIRALEDQTVCESAGDIIAVLRASLAATRPALEQYQRTSV